MMNNLNSVLIEGNLTKDPMLHETPNGTNVCSFSIATNRYYKQDQEQRQEVSYFNVEVWAKTAERCQEFLKQGRGVRVVGRLKQDRWSDENNQNHHQVKIVAEHVEFKPQFGNNKQKSARAQEEQKSEKMAARASA